MSDQIDRELLAEAWKRCFDINCNVSAHLATLRQLAREREACNCWDVGRGAGNTLLALILGAIEAGGKVTSVDMGGRWPWYHHEALNEIVTYVRGNSLKVQLPDEPIDVLLIDTMHDYEHVKNELVRYSPVVSDRGVIAVHDTTKRDDGAGKAVKEFYAEHEDEWRFVNQEQQYGMMFLYRETK